MKNSKLAILDEARQRKEKKQSEERGSILLDKIDRRQVQGLQAQEQIIQEKVLGPHQQNIREFLAECQEKYGVTISVTHNMNWDTCELTPVQKPKESKESSDANNTD